MIILFSLNAILVIELRKLETFENIRKILMMHIAIIIKIYVTNEYLILSHTFVH